MFNEDKTIAAAQKVMLEILQEIHKICVENNITYWLEAGTLLGAVRHKGFIPWDDDCDISMPRADYEKFLKVARSKLPKDMFLQTKDTDKEYPLPWAKVRKNDTLLVESGETGKENYHHGIFVDIFPYDYYKYKWAIKLMEWCRTFKDKKNKYPKGSAYRVIVTIYTNIIMALPVRIVVFIVKFFKKHKEIVCCNDGEFFTYAIEGENVRLTKKEDIIPTKLVNNVFENKDFFIPNNPDRVLKANFGASYMSLPPVEQRKTHAKYIVIDYNKE